MFQSPRWAQHHPIMSLSTSPPAATSPSCASTSRRSVSATDWPSRLRRRHDQRPTITASTAVSSPATLLARCTKSTHMAAWSRITAFRRSSSVRTERRPAPLPTMITGPTRDASVKRFDTSVRIYRPIGDQPAQWRIVMPIPNVPQREVELEIPEDVVVRDGLVGAEALEEHLRALSRAHRAHSRCGPRRHW